VARLTLFFFLLSFSGFSQSVEKKILFKGDSIWYASENQSLYSSTTKGQTWDTIFAKRNLTDTVFFNGALDTATNVFISGQKTLFVFGWDGTMHYKTILYSSSDCGKSWSKIKTVAANGTVDVHYFHKISESNFLLDCRNGYYLYSEDRGKTWIPHNLMTDAIICRDEKIFFAPDGIITYGYFRDKKCKHKIRLYTFDGGKTWVRGK
jgi:photosystem II stability/assembly factor-like uncharacterized protein